MRKRPLKKRRGRRLDEWNERIGHWPLWAQGVFWGLVCALVVALVGALGRTRGLEGGLMDSLFYMRKARYPTPEIAVVVVDEDTVIEYDAWPIPRRHFAELVDYLKRDGARTIAFDIAFSTPSHSSEDDVLLAQACARAGNVVHTAAFYTSEAQEADAAWSSQANKKTRQPEERFSWPELDPSNRLQIDRALGAFSARPELQHSAAAIGHVNVTPELDYGTLRRVPHLIRFKSSIFPSLSLAAATHALGISPLDVSIQNDELRLGRGPDAPRVPLQTRGEALVNWIGGHESFNPYSVKNILTKDPAARLPRGTFKDKVVFIGAANAGAYDHHPTPFAPLQPAVELQANATDDILSRRLLREMPVGWQNFLLVLLPVGLGILVARRNARAAVLITLGAMGAVFAVALFGFHRDFYWPLAHPMLALVGTAACCISFRQMRDAVGLKSAEERYALAARAANDGIWDWHLESGHVYYSPRWKAMLGYGETEITARTSEWFDRVHPEDRHLLDRALADHMEGRTSQIAVEFRIEHRDRSHRWALARGLMVRDEDGAPLRLAGSLSDITARRAAEEKLRKQALSDELTGLPNRVLFLDRLQKAISRLERSEGVAFAVLFLDLDRFKIVNDSLGHLVGDEMLQAVARRLEGCLRPGDTVARMGGDEFTLLIENIAGTSEAHHVAERIQAALNLPLQIQGHDFATTASIGIAIATPTLSLVAATPGEDFDSKALEVAAAHADVDSPSTSDATTGATTDASASTLLPRYLQAEDVLRDADTAMYRAKSQGRARHAVFDEKMHAQAMEQLRLEIDLRRAIENEELVLFFQPIVALDSLAPPMSNSHHNGNNSRLQVLGPALGGARLKGFEALVRWPDPARGTIPPSEFVPFAEESGLIFRLDAWVLRRACIQMREWIDASGRDDLSISVNLSGKQFEKAGLVEAIARALEESGLPPRCLRLELTEGVVMSNARTSSQLLTELKALGVSLALDDFGTGYSSLAYLHQFPLDVLKIDRSFVMRISPHNGHDEIVRTVVSLAHSLSMRVVAEGVEDEHQAALLRSIGCEYGQGYFFSRPVDAKAAFEMIQASTAQSAAQSVALA